MTEHASGPPVPEAPVTLKRGLSLPLLTLYGLGTTIGAGIYVLVGKVAGTAGVYAPLSFLFAVLLVAPTAFTFAEFASRLPLSGGEAVYVHRGLRRVRLARLVGLAVIAAGVISAAAICRGAIGYLGEFVVLDPWIALPLVVGILTFVAIWGITESAWVAAVATMLEIAGLLLVIGGGLVRLDELPFAGVATLPPLEAGPWLAIMTGAVLTFYAFLGFEDMVNVAEEVRDVRRTMPVAILLTLVVTTALYLALAWFAVRTVSPERLAESAAPLSLLFHETTGLSAGPISAIAMVAVVNGALVQINKAARVAYGLAREGWLPVGLARLHPATRTPARATAIAGAAVLGLAMFVPIQPLAEATSILVLVVFAVVNAALIALKRREAAPDGAATYPMWVPVLGLVGSLAFVCFRLGQIAFG